LVRALRRDQSTKGKQPATEDKIRLRREAECGEKKHPFHSQCQLAALDGISVRAALRSLLNKYERARFIVSIDERHQARARTLMLSARALPNRVAISFTLAQPAASSSNEMWIFENRSSHSQQ
jgi:hypothetical protein